MHCDSIFSSHQRFTLQPLRRKGGLSSALAEKEECNHILKMASGAADRNHQAALAVEPSQQNTTVRGLLSQPAGWQKFRHLNYQTTDMNLVKDGFLPEDLAWIQEKLDVRLSPILERIYGIPRTAIRANDMFVVRYDSTERARLANHTDEADISINILLTDDFVGGGTRFWDRTTETSFAHLQPQQAGQLVTHSATINHEGVHVTEGVRMILVGFLSVDKIDPFDSSPTGLGTFASWLSIPWMATKFREAYASADHRIANGVEKWSNNKYVRALFLDMANLLEELGDFFCPHHANTLVKQEDADAFVESLDKAYLSEKPKDKASWFQGQLVQLDIDGTVTHAYPTR